MTSLTISYAVTVVLGVYLAAVVHGRLTIACCGFIVGNALSALVNGFRTKKRASDEED